MATLKLHKDRLRNNYNFLKTLFDRHGISWGVVSKLLCGNELFLQELIDLGVREIHDSRLSNLVTVKELDADIQTVYIKPPPTGIIPDIVRYADVSLNTEFETINLLSEEAVKQGKIHKVIIMIELGDLREGVMGDHLVDFYSKVFDLPNIEVVGLGANLNCLHGVMPNRDKLIQLSLYKQIIELKFGKRIPWVSGGTTVTVPLLFNRKLPKGVNHFRVGEALFFGKNLFTGKTIKGMYDDVFELEAEIIELTEKPVIPDGDFGENPMGEVTDVNEKDYGRKSWRAILDIGLLDINPKFLIPMKEGLDIVGASSDMIVLDVGDNGEDLSVGDVIRFKVKYMGALHLLSSDYISKVVVEGKKSKKPSRKEELLKTEIIVDN